MTAYQNNYLIELEEYFGGLINDDGLTNKQALAKVKETYGEHGHEYISDVIKKEEQLDNGIIVDYGV